MTSGMVITLLPSACGARYGRNAKPTTKMHRNMVTSVIAASATTSQPLQGGFSASVGWGPSGEDGTNGGAAWGDTSVIGLFGELTVLPLSRAPATSIAVEVVSQR